MNLHKRVFIPDFWILFNYNRSCFHYRSIIIYQAVLTTKKPIRRAILNSSYWLAHLKLWQAKNLNNCLLIASRKLYLMIMPQTEDTTVQFPPRYTYSQVRSNNQSNRKRSAFGRKRLQNWKSLKWRLAIQKLQMSAKHSQKAVTQFNPISMRCQQRRKKRKIQI